MEKIWIIGIGQFGLLALKRLSKTGKDRQFVLVDPNEENLLQGQGPNCDLKQDDGVAFLEKHLQTDNKPDWIIAALPVHLAAGWCMTRLGSEQLRRITLPAEIEPLLPNPLRGDQGDIYVSHADFKCPDDCAEPRDICTITQKPRKRNMFEVLADIHMLPFQSLVIRSHQMGPGIGGYRPEQLFTLLDQVKEAKGDILVCTACRCHGVVTGLRRL